MESVLGWVKSLVSPLKRKEGAVASKVHADDADSPRRSDRPQGSLVCAPAEYVADAPLPKRRRVRLEYEDVGAAEQVTSGPTGRPLPHVSSPNPRDSVENGRRVFRFSSSPYFPVAPVAHFHSLHRNTTPPALRSLRQHRNSESPARTVLLQSKKTGDHPSRWSLYANAARWAQGLRLEAELMERIVASNRTRITHAVEQQVEAMQGVQRGKYIVEGQSPDAVDSMELQQYRRHVADMASWDRLAQEGKSAVQPLAPQRTEFASREKAELQEANKKFSREWSALQQRLNTALSISDVSSTSLQEARRYEQQLSGDLARMAEQRERRKAIDIEPVCEELDRARVEEEEEEEEVVLLSDSESESEEAGEGFDGEEDEVPVAEYLADGVEQIEPHELYAVGALDSGLRPLSAKQMQTYQRIMRSTGPDDQVLATHPISREEILRTDFFRLGPGNWLSDESINMYMKLLQQRDTKLHDMGLKHIPKCHFFTSFFYGKLFSDKKKYDYKSVQRWTGPKRLKATLQSRPSILECDKIFVPIHQPCHWCMAVIDIREKCLRYYDSLHGRDEQCLEALAFYIKDEAADKGGLKWDTSTWRKEFPMDVPGQQNGYDCGMFAVKFADYESRGRAFAFSQQDMPYFRKRMVVELADMEAC